MQQGHKSKGFTLIELSVVLVIIGLIVGGILVGQNLIKGAEVRAQISQIEKFNSAVNTFYGKYQALPGDMPSNIANRFGFNSRNNPCAAGVASAEGDGNGLIEGSGNVNSPCVQQMGAYPRNGEALLFWQDLSQAGLINGGFSAVPNGSYYAPSASITPDQCFPKSSIGNANYVTAWSGGYQGEGTALRPGDQNNYFAVSIIGSCVNNSPTLATVGMTVQQAYAIDNKMDDGQPQSGRVLALYPLGATAYYASWAAGNGQVGASGSFSTADPNFNGPVTTATPQTSSTCYDNNNVVGNGQSYSLGTLADYGTHINCALSFRMQGAGR